MRYTYLALLLLLTTTIDLSGQSAEHIIKKHIKAIGGLKLINKEESIHTIGTFEGASSGNGKIEVFSLHNKGFRMDMTRNDTTRSTVMYDGYQWTETTPGKKSKPQKMPDAVWQSMDLDLAGEIVDYKKKGSKAEYAGRDN